MSNVVEIRWHGRGGQGAKTAALLLAESASQVGKFIQGFPEYGPERMGAPVTAYNRISDKPIRIHCNIANPNVVVVLDPTLIGSTTDVAKGVPEDGIFIINTNKSPEEMRKKLGIKTGKVYTVDANQISLETIGRVIPNTPLMGALIRVTGIIPYEAFVEDTKKQLEKKFRSKPEVIEGNLKAIERAYQEVKGE
ncbi:Pyruvate synthase subunit PorC [Koleobacter methoxysyntrophicus]|jgi:pyruvate ferredoxin oxidoreductase gamma subunit|uniref:Pyruvate synthase subunit PorC n=1 Tax=Koleobacter methoxysyntrophicus TaxID=2751313 RepID=A0A8A0RM32_9FIRM|nr:2-oxoacid:acceptor oxidoreductase family protein [Koleobacter methoxysyntrophicus]QSQ08579.1 Pyruvate synthase subunit PorC [Koleobacter methoxysyntrophicus]